MSHRQNAPAHAKRLHIRRSSHKSSLPAISNNYLPQPQLPRSTFSSKRSSKAHPLIQRLGIINMCPLTSINTSKEHMPSDIYHVRTKQKSPNPPRNHFSSNFFSASISFPLTSFSSPCKLLIYSIAISTVLALLLLCCAAVPVIIILPTAPPSCPSLGG